jgi:hypothetical protein
MHTMWARRSVLVLVAMLVIAQCSAAVGDWDHVDLRSAAGSNIKTKSRLGQSDDGASDSTGPQGQLHEKDTSAILSRLSALEAQVQDLQKQLRGKDSGK